MLASALSQSAPLLTAMGGTAALVFGALRFNRDDAQKAVETMQVIVDEQSGALERLRKERDALVTTVEDRDGEILALKVELVGKDDELRHHRRHG